MGFNSAFKGLKQGVPTRTD